MQGASMPMHLLWPTEQRAPRALIIFYLIPLVVCDLTTEKVNVHTEKTVPNSNYTGRSQKEIKKIFKKHGIIPDLIDEAPQYELSFRYVGGIWPDFGSRYSPEQLRYAPFALRFPAIPNARYSLFMFDLDSPSRKNPTQRAYFHWGLANIPKYNILAAEYLARYLGPFPDNGTGEHRYVFLLYKQPSDKVEYSEPRLLHVRDDPLRAHWDLRKFVKKYNLEGPVAGNFLYSKWHPPSDNPYSGYSTIVKHDPDAPKAKPKMKPDPSFLQ